MRAEGRERPWMSPSKLSQDTHVRTEQPRIDGLHELYGARNIARRRGAPSATAGVTGAALDSNALNIFGLWPGGRGLSARSLSALPRKRTDAACNRAVQRSQSDVGGVRRQRQVQHKEPGPVTTTGKPCRGRRRRRRRHHLKPAAPQAGRGCSAGVLLARATTRVIDRPSSGARSEGAAAMKDQLLARDGDARSLRRHHRRAADPSRRAKTGPDRVMILLRTHVGGRAPKS